MKSKYNREFAEEIYNYIQTLQKEHGYLCLINRKEDSMKANVGMWVYSK